MHILFISGYFAPAWGYGGPVRLLFELTSRLASQGNEVTVLTTDVADNLGRYEAGAFYENGVRIIRLRNLSQRLAYHHKKFIALGLPHALRTVLPQVDVLHIVGARNFPAVIGGLLARQYQVPYVLAAYGTLPADGRGWKRVGTPLVDYFFARHTIRAARFCLAQTIHERDLYFQFGVRSERIRFSPLAGDGNRFQQLPCRGSFRRRFGLSDSEKVILFVGRIHLLKGLDILVKSVHNIKEQGMPVRLVVVGRDDGHEQYVRDLVRKLGLEQTVLFVGPLYCDDVLSAYVDADVFALTPRHFEETTLAGLEACFCGTQVVVTEEAEIPYLVESGAGTVVRNQVALIAQALVEALTDDETVRRRGQAARTLAYSHFDWDILLPLYEKVYEDASNRGANILEGAAWGAMQG